MALSPKYMIFYIYDCMPKSIGLNLRYANLLDVNSETEEAKTMEDYAKLEKRGNRIAVALPRPFRLILYLLSKPYLLFRFPKPLLPVLLSKVLIRSYWLFIAKRRQNSGFPLKEEKVILSASCCLIT